MDEVAGRHAGRIAVETLRHAPLPVPVVGSLSRQNIMACTQLAGVLALATAVVVGAPLLGWPAVVRLPAALVPALALGVAAHRPWRWGKADWDTLDVRCRAPW